jgi:hypothetical protein
MIERNRFVRVSNIVLVAWMMLFIAFVCVHRTDPDFGWHFRSGQYILAHGIPSHDVFSYTAPNFRWIDHEWLSDVIIYSIASRFGYATLAILFAIIWTVALVVAMRRHLSWSVAGIALAGVLLYIGARSDAWTALGLALTLLILDMRPSHYWLLVPLMAVWANLHAGFVAGFALIAVKIVLERSRVLLVWLAAAVFATVANPYGIGLYAELARTLGDNKLSTSIAEWAPLSINQDVAAYLVAIAMCLVVWRTWDFFRTVGTGFVAATVWSNRNMSLLVVGTVGMIAELSHLFARQLNSSVRVPSWIKSGIFTFSISVLVGVFYPVSLLLFPPVLADSLTLQYPAMALASLRTQVCPGHLFNDYNYGGIILWKLPGVPDYIDGRMPSWVGPRGRYLNIYDRTLNGGSFTAQEFARFNIQCALISRYDTHLSSWLGTQPSWHLDIRSQDAQLWRKS